MKHDMAHPIHVDDHALNLTWREVAGMVLGAAAFFAFLTLFFLIGSAT